MSHPTDSTKYNRRHFLQTSSVTAASLLGAQAVQGQGVKGANDRLSIGLIGVGVRGSYHLRTLQALANRANVEVTAVCDVWKTRLNRAATAVEAKWHKAPMKTTRFGELLADGKVDAVVIATPDFSHTPIMTAALKAGKDVYIEKPMAMEVEEANQVLDLTRKTGAVVQVGTQRRSDGHFKAVAKLIATNVLGKITRVSSEYNFNHARWAFPFDKCKEADIDWDAFMMNLPKRKFDPRILCRWQLKKMCSNGMPGIWMAHYTDAVNMVLGTTYPSRVMALGGVYYWKEDRENDDTFRAVLEYPEGLLMCWGMALANEAGRYWTVHGTKGTIDMQNWWLLRKGGKNTSIQDRKIEAEPSDSHMGNWLACIRSRKQPNANIEAGHQHAISTIMASTARDSGQRQTYDPTRRVIAAG